MRSLVVAATLVLAPTAIAAQPVDPYAPAVPPAAPPAAAPRDVEVDTAVTAYRQQYPTTMRFPYRIVQDKAPFRVRAMWHDDHRTFIRAGARELPALYEYKDGIPSLVNFEVHDGVYVVPKVLDAGYFMLGAARKHPQVYEKVFQQLSPSEVGRWLWRLFRLWMQS